MLGFSKLNSEKTEAVVRIVSTYARRTGEAVIKKRVEIYVGDGVSDENVSLLFSSKKKSPINIPGAKFEQSI